MTTHSAAALLALWAVSTYDGPGAFAERFLFPGPGAYTITAEVFPGGDIKTPCDSRSIPVTIPPPP